MCSTVYYTHLMKEWQKRLLALKISKNERGFSFLTTQKRGYKLLG